MGWVAISNLALLTFLALKNTPLAILTHRSYEKLRPLHQISGYTTVALVIIHGVSHLVALAASGDLHTSMAEQYVRMGPVAGVAVLLIGITATFMRRTQYEAFYTIHTVLFMLVIIAVGMHRPELSKTRAAWAVVFAGAIWTCDRTWRLANLALNFSNNSATLTPLSNGRVRVAFKKAPLLRSLSAGQHAFLWLPRIRWFQTHPFTVSGTNPPEFVIQARDGFTKELAAYAREHPGESIRASMDGPYGCLPKFADYDHVILVAGGSGGSFTSGVAAEMCSQIASAGSRILHFIWVVRDQSDIQWFAPQLEVIQACSFARVEIYVSSSKCSSVGSLSGLEEALKSRGRTVAPVTSEGHVDLEKSSPTVEPGSSGSPAAVSMIAGRPDIPVLLRGIVEEAQRDERILITTCGPTALQKDVTDTARSAMMKRDGRIIDFYAETFGW